MRILIPTCDKYRNLLEAHKYTLDKFGGPTLDVTVLGYKRPNFELTPWKFFSLGKDTGPENFTNEFHKFFDEFEDEYFIYGNDDGVLTGEFNHKFLAEIIDTIKDIPNFGRIWLTRATPKFYGLSGIIKDFGSYQIGEIDQSADYRLSLQCSLWKTSYFKKYLLPNLSPWQWELRHSAKNDGHAILIPINNAVINLGHIIRSFNKEKPEFLEGWEESIYGDSKLNSEDTEIVKELFKKHDFL